MNVLDNNLLINEGCLFYDNSEVSYSNPGICWSDVIYHGQIIAAIYERTIMSPLPLTDITFEIWKTVPRSEAPFLASWGEAESSEDEIIAVFYTLSDLVNYLNSCIERGVSYV